VNAARLIKERGSLFWPSVVASEVRQGFQDRSRGMKGSQESLTTAVVKDAANWPTPNCMDVITPTRDLTSMESKGHWGKQPRNRPDGIGFTAPNTGKLSEMVNYGQAAPASSSSLGNRQELWLTHTNTGTGRVYDGRRGRDLESCITNPQAWATPRGYVQAGPDPNRVNRPTSGGDDLVTQIARVQSNMTAKLNPRWVETLMGLPIGWTMPSCASPQTIAPMSCDSLAMALCLPPQSEPSEFSLAS
jgi:hypothetical protein